MRMWAFLAAALLTSLVLAGCSDDNDNGDGDSTSSTSSSPSSTSTSSSSTSSSSSTTSSSSTSTSTGPTGNRAPTGSISASVSNGSLPLSVNFTLEATDADGDHLAWDLDFGDGSRTNGTVVPATVTHEYATVGNYTASYAVSDGKLQSTVSVNITVVAGTGGGATTQVVAAEWQGGACYAYQADMMAAQALAGIAYALFAVDAGTIGQPFTVEYTGTDAWLVWGIAFFDADNAEVEGGVETILELYTLQGTVPEGAAQAVIYSCPGAMESATYTAG